MDRISFTTRFDYMMNNIHIEKLLSSIPSGRCSLNQNKCKEYIHLASQIDPSLGKAVEIILENTTYVSIYDLRENIRRSVESFKSSIGDTPYVILVDQGKDNSARRFNSEHLMLVFTWDILKQTNLRGIYDYQDEIPENISTAMWIDDCIYTGGNATEIISRQHKGIDTYERTFGNTPRFKDIHIVVAYASPHKERLLDEFPYMEFHFHIGQQIPLYTDICNIDIYDYFFSWDEKPMIYFDHKIASMDSTFSHIYMGQVPQRKLTEEEKHGDRYVCIGSDIGYLTSEIPSRSIILTLESLFYS